MNTKETFEKEFTNPYDEFAKALFAKYQKEYFELCNKAITIGFPAPKNPLVLVGKDTPDGTTHSYNDGCGEPAHNPVQKPWEEFEFDSAAYSQGKCIYPLIALRSAEEHRIKNFIRDVILREREEMVKIIENLKKDTKVINCGTPGGVACPGCAECGGQENCICETYNQALSDILLKLTNNADHI